ncbi:MAG: lysylphosphatidylglycerol synthase transmembrane domain-containing protein [Balneolaceae bacterium]
MSSRTGKIILSLLVALLFFWLAFRDINVTELMDQIRDIRYHWILPLAFATLASHYLRAERWRLFLGRDGVVPPRSTLFAGVMTGYMLNYVFPRLGEVARPVYVARKSGITTGKLLGTIVLERILDVLCLIAFLLFIMLYLIRDGQLLDTIFGTDEWATYAFVLLPALLISFFAIVWLGYRWLVHAVHKQEEPHPWLIKIYENGKLFWNGLIAIRDIKSWPLFLVYTLGIWIGYAAMAWFPLWMLDLHILYDLGLSEAVIVTVVSAAGMTMPVPGGLGAYHLFVQQTLWVLYSVPLVPALTYATVTHAAMLLFAFLIGGGTLWFDKYYTLTHSVEK